MTDLAVLDARAAFVDVGSEQMHASIAGGRLASPPRRRYTGCVATARREPMTLCPVALAVGCRRCPLFKVCPAKDVLGDYKEEPGEAKPGESKAPAANAQDKK